MRSTSLLPLALVALSACNTETKSTTDGPRPAPHSANAGEESGHGAVDATIATLMHRKVECASTLLVAISLRDYPSVERSAEELRSISEQGAFIVHDTLTYRALSDTFRRDVALLATHAHDRNQEAMESDYHRITATCFDCHTHVRDERAKGALPGRMAMR